MRPIWGDAASLKEADLVGGITYTANATTRELSWVAGTADENTFNGVAYDPGAFVARAADHEVRALMKAPTGSTARGGPMARVIVNGSPAEVTGYGVRETTPGDPSSWQLFKTSGYKVDGTVGTVTSLGTCTSTTATAYPVWVSIMAKGTDIWVKVWSNVGEPAWDTAVDGVLKVTDSTYTTGRSPCVCAFGLGASGDKVAYTPGTCNATPVNNFGYITGGSTASTTDGTSFSISLTTRVSELLCITTCNTVASGTADAPSSITVPAGMTLNTTPLADSTAISGVRVRMYSATVTGDSSGGSLVFTFPNTQTAFVCHVTRLVGGHNTEDGGATAFGTADVTSSTSGTATSITGGLTFSNPHGTSGFVSCVYHNTNEATTAGSPALLVTSSPLATPNFCFATQAANSNDTTPSMSWATLSSDRLIVSAEVYNNDWYDSTSKVRRKIHGYRLRRN